jgi:hypothetical protein
MSHMMIVVEFEDKPKHRNQFIELMRGHAQRSRRVCDGHAGKGGAGPRAVRAPTQ